ncbi:hypothetical protein B0T13DRAFT_48993 [Neurospora crassa]|nr:hypothetical protein B0T13DRAFT_48993 [Neurospora crassa]
MSFISTDDRGTLLEMHLTIHPSGQPRPLFVLHNVVNRDNENIPTFTRKKQPTQLLEPLPFEPFSEEDLLTPRRNPNTPQYFPLVPSSRPTHRPFFFAYHSLALRHQFRESNGLEGQIDVLLHSSQPSLHRYLKVAWAPLLTTFPPINQLPAKTPFNHHTMPNVLIGTTPSSALDPSLPLFGLWQYVCSLWPPASHALRCMMWLQ